MVITNIDTDFGQENDFISIDLSNYTDPNSVLDIYEQLNPFTHEYEYRIQAQWVANKDHPIIKMDEKNFLDFAQAVNKTANKILNR